MRVLHTQPGSIWSQLGCLGDLALETYRRRQSKRGDDVNFSNGAPFKYIETPEYLSEQPKFSDKYGDRYPGSRASTPVVSAPGSDVSSSKDWGVAVTTASTELIGDSGAEDLVALDRRARPAGLKKMRAQDSIADDVKQAAESSSKITSEKVRGNDLYYSCAARFQESAERMEYLKLLQIFKYGSSEHTTVMDEFMAERAEIRIRKRYEALYMASKVAVKHIEEDFK